VLKLIVEVFPESAGAHQGLAEASWRAEDLSAARAGFDRTLPLLDADPPISASEKLERRAHAEDRLLQLRREHATETPRIYDHLDKDGDVIEVGCWAWAEALPQGARLGHVLLTRVEGYRCPLAISAIISG